MDSKLLQVSRMLKRYDSKLYPKRFLDGTLGIFRANRRFDFYRSPELRCVLWFAKDDHDLVIPSTHNWQENGVPVDWGIEPIFWEIQKLDSHGYAHDDYERFAEKRDQISRNKARAWHNENRAIAADMRRDFAKATNDINTSNLEKIDSRRKKDGYRR